MERPSRPLILATLALLTLIWGTTWAAIHVGLRGIPPFKGVALRFLVSSALLFAVSPWLKVEFGKSRRERGLWILVALLSFCTSYGVVYWCQQWVPSGLSSVLFATFPLFVALLAHVALPGERLRPASFLGVLIGFGGVALLFSEDFRKLFGPRVLEASIVMLASPLVSALSAVAVKRWGRGVHPVSLSAVPMGIAAVVMGGLALALEGDRPAIFDAASTGALLYLAVFGSAVTFTLYYWLMLHLPATRVSLIAYAVPVVAVATGALFLDEPITWRMICGTGFVVLGVSLAGRRRG